MTWRAHWRHLIAVVVALATVATADAAPSAASTQSDNRILVMLRLPPPHFRAGADYASSYGDGLGRAARRRIAGALARRHGVTLVDDWPMPLLGIDCFVMAVRDGRSPVEVAAALSAAAGVAWSQPVNSFTAQATARADPLFAAQPAAVAWHLADLHRVADGRGVRVAIVDSAIDTGHPDLAGQIVVAENFVADRASVPEQHGTAVAGIVAARGGNGVGIVGIAPRARLMGLRACWQALPPARAVTVCDSFSLAKAITFAVEHDAQVINLSFGGPHDQLLARLVEVGLRRGIAVVAAVDPAQADGGFPASHAGVIAVADDGAGRFPRGTYLAPGRGVPTTQVGGKWSVVDGSSFAAAHVTGLVALLRSQAATRRGALQLVAAADGGAIDSCATLTTACPTIAVSSASRN